MEMQMRERESGSRSGSESDEHNGSYTNASTSGDRTRTSGHGGPARVESSSSVPNLPSTRKGGLLHPRVNSMLQSVCGVLEYGEKII